MYLLRTFYSLRTTLRNVQGKPARPVGAEQVPPVLNTMEELSEYSLDQGFLFLTMFDLFRCKEKCETFVSVYSASLSQ